jgi:hypothetical protein
MGISAKERGKKGQGWTEKKGTNEGQREEGDGLKLASEGRKNERITEVYELSETRLSSFPLDTSKSVMVAGSSPLR